MNQPMEQRRRAAIPELLTVTEVAGLLRISRSKVYELVASQELVAFKPGGRIRILAADVRAFLGRSQV